MKVILMAKMVGETIVLAVLIAAAAITTAASDASSIGLKSKIDHSAVQTLTSGADQKRLQDRMAEDLLALAVCKEPRSDDDSRDNLSASNSSSSDSIPLNSSATNMLRINASGNYTAELENETSTATPSAKLNGKASEGVGSSSSTSFSGYYGITASRHETGKSYVQSRTFLNGTFEMDKSVKFQDRGF
jgi:opacity protein-like surface antigen